MTTYTTDDFAHANIATRGTHDVARRVDPGAKFPWVYGDSEVESDKGMAEHGWHPVREGSEDLVQQLRARIHKHEEYLKALRRRHGLGACETFKSEFGHGQCDRCGWVKDEHGRVPVPYPEPLSLDTLREAWEQAEVPTEDTPIREGDVLIYPLFAGYCVRPSWGDSPLPEARVLRRAPRHRSAQARAEAKRRFGDGEDDRSASCRRNQKRFNGFMQGVEWADANPKPITSKAVGDAWWNATGGGSHAVDFTTFFLSFGIKVVDDE